MEEGRVWRGEVSEVSPTWAPLPALLPSESLAGFLLSVSADSRMARLRIPFPQTGTWFLTLRSLCGVGPR